MMAILDLAQCLCSVKNEWINEKEREILKVYKMYFPWTLHLVLFNTDKHKYHIYSNQ